MSKIAMSKLVVEGYKRTRRIEIAPTELGLTTLSGKNKQGKTSVLDAICHGLLGPTYLDRVANVINTDAEKIEGTKGAKARIQFELSDGTKVERRFTDKNERTGILEVTLPDGSEGSQEDVNNFFSAAALKLPDLSAMSERERLKFLLGGLGIDITDLEEQYENATKKKELAFQHKEQARRAFEDLPHYPEAPKQLVSLGDLTKEYQEAVEHNKVTDNASAELRRATSELSDIDEQIEDYKNQIARLQKKIATAQDDRSGIEARIAKVNAIIDTSKPIDIEPIKERMSKVEDINDKVRANTAKEQKKVEAEEALNAWRHCDAEQSSALSEMAQRIQNADVPIDAIGVKFMNNQWVVTFSDMPWSNMSGMQRIMFRVAVASLYNKNARLVLVDGLEALDDDMQEGFNAWLIERGLQSIATEVRTSVGESNFVKLLIEDGSVKGKE